MHAYSGLHFSAPTAISTVDLERYSRLLDQQCHYCPARVRRPEPLPINGLCYYKRLCSVFVTVPFSTSKHITMAKFHPENELLPHIIDHYARVKPDAPYTEYPKSSMSYEDGYLPITYRAFANAINGVAWWLTATFGPGQGEVLAYIGPNDIRYPALVMGAVKAGYCMFLTSPRNSAAAHESLLR